jgi:trehalose-6-phosphate synthase
MPLEERQGRHGQIIKSLTANDIKLWGERFVDALMAQPGADRQKIPA